MLSLIVAVVSLNTAAYTLADVRSIAGLVAISRPQAAVDFLSRTIFLAAMARVMTEISRRVEHEVLRLLTDFGV